MTPAPPSRRAFGIVAVVETVSLAALLINLATARSSGLAGIVGPIHGSAYLIAIALSFSGPFSSRARLLTFIPGIGALLAHRLSMDSPEDRPSEQP
ncbi:hypothetical protein [Allobranchiibius huperziae]|uniref:DUF3817 domain-containing protein n=1 Tax=Allobranchiibius huperziae TaxID=1874116 RepID=A0A853D8T0_9MICO|nr:hypothetical protein [Allobranchiibius huperziae]NYJ73866.1 hypothetical protein [Allobranchiibius huperziae]